VSGSRRSRELQGRRVRLHRHVVTPRRRRQRLGLRRIEDSHALGRGAGRECEYHTEEHDADAYHRQEPAVPDETRVLRHVVVQRQDLVHVPGPLGDVIVAPAAREQARWRLRGQH
jgi:hypothetical protein